MAEAIAPEMRRFVETEMDMAFARMRVLKTSVAPTPVLRDLQ